MPLPALVPSGSRGSGSISGAALAHSGGAATIAPASAAAAAAAEPPSVPLSSSPHERSPPDIITCAILLWHQLILDGLPPHERPSLPAAAGQSRFVAAATALLRSGIAAAVCSLRCASAVGDTSSLSEPSILGGTVGGIHVHTAAPPASSGISSSTGALPATDAALRTPSSLTAAGPATTAPPGLAMRMSSGSMPAPEGSLDAELARAMSIMHICTPTAVELPDARVRRLHA